MNIAGNLIVTALLAVSPVIGMADAGHEPDKDDADHAPTASMLGSMDMDAANGRVLFAEKGCVACHSVNGVGGEDAVPLDSHGMEEDMNPFDLAAKMWAMAPYMIAAQEEAMGGQILFTGRELGDIVAFLHSDAQQHGFTEATLPEEVREMLEKGHGHGGMAGEEAHKEELGHD